MLFHFKADMIISTILLILFSIAKSQSYPPPDETCPDASHRNPYDPRMAFNKKLSPSATLHPRSEDIATRVKTMITSNKVSFGRKTPIYVVDRPTTTWETYDIIYRNNDENAVWATFSVPPLDGPGVYYANSKTDGSEDWPFVIFDPNHPIYGPYTELRGWHTYIDHINKIFYCEGCGLFKYNNDGQILNPSNQDLPPNTISDGQSFNGAGTGCGLSWPGVVRRQDIQSGVIAHAIRVAHSSCDFFIPGQTIYVPPAVESDQPNGCSVSQNYTYSVAMGYRFRLASSVNCDNRLAPQYENNGIWYPPTQKQTDFIRMFCRAVRDYGWILSDGSGDDGSLIFQGEHTVTANYNELFGSNPDESTYSWSYLIRDMKSSQPILYPDAYDNRYRDERYGIPWDETQVVLDSSDGNVNNCCLDSNQCTTTPAPTISPYVDTTPGPQCLNENCCFKNRIIKHKLRINDDNCVVYNCTFLDVAGADIVKVYTKKDGNFAENTLIELNIFNINPNENQDAIDIVGGINTKIYNNWFSDTIQDDYNPIRIKLADTVYIENNTFTGPNRVIAINFGGIYITDIQNVNIIGNTFNNMNYGIIIQKTTNTNIKNNIFTNFAGTAIRWQFVSSPQDISNGVNIEGNIIQNVASGIYVSYDIGLITITDNTIDSTTSIHNGKGIEFVGTSTGAVVDGNIITNTIQDGIYVEEGNVNMQIINNEIGNTGDHAIDIRGDNYFISANCVHDIDTSGSSGRALYIHSYGIISRNKIYASSRRGISISGTNTNPANGQIIIENNIIYGINQEPIDFYVTDPTYSASKAIVRFNTIVTDTGSKAIDLDSDVSELDLYCNLVVALTISDFWQTETATNEFGNLQILVADINTIEFINDDFATLDTVDLHVSTTSPVLEQCNTLQIAILPLPTVDFDGTIRSTVVIDVGADQVSPVGTFAPTTVTSTPTTTSPTTNAPITNTPITNAPSTNVEQSIAPTPNVIDIPGDDIGEESLCLNCIYSVIIGIVTTMLFL
eukprot:538402_1